MNVLQGVHFLNHFSKAKTQGFSMVFRNFAKTKNSRAKEQGVE